MSQKILNYASLYLRLALSAGFLSAVADRFGWWGTAGTPNVAWGNWENFMAYTAKLNIFVAHWPITIAFLAWVATILEVALGVLLLIGFQIRYAAFASGLLLLFFAVAMTLTTGIKAPLDFSVFTASGGAFLLTALGRYPFSLDARNTYK